MSSVTDYREQARTLLDKLMTMSIAAQKEEFITSALQSAADAREDEIIALKLEIARLKVKPIVDREKEGERVDADIMNIRFTGGK